MKIESTITGHLFSTSFTKNNKPLANLLVGNDAVHIVCSQGYCENLSTHLGEIVNVPVTIYTDSSYLVSSSYSVGV